MQKFLAASRHPGKTPAFMLITLLCWLAVGTAGADTGSDPAYAGQAGSLVVGNVSLALGKAYLESAEHGRRPARAGAEVYLQDRIRTGPNGHVHIEFIDGALVSVRPDSRLQVQRYDYDASRPQQSAVKFSLEEGVTRSVSGDAARSARERFRLNTPIAAIGVRGTDFVVSATATDTRARVYEGTIVVAPYSAECSSDALGPCIANAVELSGSSLQMLALDDAASAPQLLPGFDLRNPGLRRSGTRAGSGASTNSNSDNAAQADGVAASANAGSGEQNSDGAAAQPAAAADTVAAASGPAPAAGDSLATTAAVVEEDSVSLASNLEAVQEAVTVPGVNADVARVEEEANRLPNFVPDAALSLSELQSRQLVWGRYARFGGPAPIPEDMELITASFADASAGREVTVGTFDYGLFRVREPGERVRSDNPIVGFALDSAQAFYSSESGIMAMQVNGGSLDIDFAERQFNTSLQLSHEDLGQIGFDASGRLFSGGFFHASSDTQSIRGAVSTDAREAGYFFERQFEQGQIQGLTLWDSQ